MNETYTPRQGQPTRFLPRLSAGIREVFTPTLGEGAPLRNTILKLRQAVALLGVFATVVQIVVWLMIGVIGGDLDVPWWLWSALFTALAVGGFTVAHRIAPDSSDVDEN
ncbi:MAG TPA: hypothetical protein VE172_06555 [Stackebrandtia sp.]|uniref:hypothetical protein n=1 Tax=Stackebrandtia sp. TaxID=2023065 RepID=UPI002D4474DF|nr:hypothetical protein [Stackebrandtia sp.]HZE38458.1 hypothetical protein [Stackebrandtia sp.]